VGHGSNNNLADEQVLRNSDIATLVNENRRCVFMAFSCDVGMFDDNTEQSMAEEFVSQPNGGAIGAICASQVSWSWINDILSEYFYSHLFPERRVLGDISVGESLWAAKVQVGEHEYHGVNFGAVHNVYRYHFFSDPALVLATPPDGLAFAPGSVDTLGGGTKETVIIDLAASGLNGTTGREYDLRVEESRHHTSAPYINSRGEYLREEYFWLPGSTIYRGAGTISGDMLSVSFKVPLQVRYGDTARLRLIVESDDGPQCASALVPLTPVSVTVLPAEFAGITWTWF